MNRRENLHFPWKWTRILALSMVMAMMMGGAGCTSTHYRSKGLANVTFGKRENHHRKVSLQGKSEFYFFGLIPEVNELYVDEWVKERGHDEISRLKIEEFISWKDVLWSVLSLGFYTPRSFSISGFAPGKANYEESKMDQFKQNEDRDPVF